LFSTETFLSFFRQLKFGWNESLSTINPNISLSQFKLDVVLQDTYATDYYDLAYPGVIMRLHLSRQIGYHVVQTYLPSVVFVVLAWLSMFISPESVPGEGVKLSITRKIFALSFTAGHARRRRRRGRGHKELIVSRLKRETRRKNTFCLSFFAASRRRQTLSHPSSEQTIILSNVNPFCSTLWPLPSNANASLSLPSSHSPSKSQRMSELLFIHTSQGSSPPLGSKAEKNVIPSFE